MAEDVPESPAPDATPPLGWFTPRNLGISIMVFGGTTALGSLSMALLLGHVQVDFMGIILIFVGRAVKEGGRTAAKWSVFLMGAYALGILAGSIYLLLGRVESVQIGGRPLDEVLIVGGNPLPDWAFVLVGGGMFLFGLWPAATVYGLVRAIRATGPTGTWPPKRRIPLWKWLLAGTPLFLLLAAIVYYVWDASRPPPYARVEAIEERYVEQLEHLRFLATHPSAGPTTSAWDALVDRDLFDAPGVVGAEVLARTSGGWLGRTVKEFSFPVGSSTWAPRDPGVEDPVVNVTTSGDEKYAVYSNRCKDAAGRRGEYRLILDLEELRELSK